MNIYKKHIGYVSDYSNSHIISIEEFSEIHDIIIDEDNIYLIYTYPDSNFIDFKDMDIQIIPFHNMNNYHLNNDFKFLKTIEVTRLITISNLNNFTIQQDVHKYLVYIKETITIREERYNKLNNML
jgi:hypothetical protein